MLEGITRKGKRVARYFLQVLLEPDRERNGIEESGELNSGVRTLNNRKSSLTCHIFPMS